MYIMALAILWIEHFGHSMEYYANNHVSFNIAVGTGVR